MPYVRPGSPAHRFRALIKANKIAALAKKEKLKAKQEARRLARIAAKVARTESPADGLQDLPLSVAVAIEQNAARSAKPAPVEPKAEATVDELVTRLLAIRERIWRLQSVFAVSLSQEVAIEANRFLLLFQELAAELKVKAPDALAALTVGHESLLLAPAMLVKPTISLDTQRVCEMRWLAVTQPGPRAPKRPADTIHDGMGAFL
jgi:hypothetical protein